jgi:hypothetical protein
MKYVHIINKYTRGSQQTIKKVECILLDQREFSIYIEYLTNLGKPFHHSKQNVYYEGIHVAEYDKIKPEQEYTDVVEMSDYKRNMINKLFDILKVKEIING